MTQCNETVEQRCPHCGQDWTHMDWDDLDAEPPCYCDLTHPSADPLPGNEKP